MTALSTPSRRAASLRPRRGALLALLAFALAGTVVAGPAGRTPAGAAGEAAGPDVDLLLLGEEHDVPEHHALEAQTAERLADAGRLAALALEMAERGRSTAGLPRDADAAQVRAALAWNERGWPWAHYGAAVMAAQRRGVPVVGANLPRAEQAQAMRDAALDATLDAAVRERLREDVREGHCGLLPESQLPGMVRVQIARDRAMAATLAGLATPGRMVLLIAGAGHVDATRGVPLHLQRLAPALRVRTVRLAAGAAAGEATPGFDDTWPTAAPPSRGDPCEGLARQLAPAR
jgi:uncharacterized iron-regulated protein